MPSDIDDLSERALACFDAGDYPEALRLLQEALAMEPENLDALYGLSAIYEINGKMDKVVEVSARIRSVWPVLVVTKS